MLSSKLFRLLFYLYWYKSQMSNPYEVRGYRPFHHSTNQAFPLPPVFSYFFKNVHLSLENSAPKKVWLFLEPFLQTSNVHFGNQYKKTDFFIPSSFYSKKKVSSRRKVNVYFLWTKKSKMQETPQYFVKRFLYKGLRFSLPFQHLFQTSRRQNDWSLLVRGVLLCTLVSWFSSELSKC